MHTFYWNRIDFTSNTSVVEKNSALTIGSFDGPHIGHEALFKAVFEAASKQKLVPGIVTFIRPLPSFKQSSSYIGDIATLPQRLAGYEKRGFQFALLIDFSYDFARMSGTEFLNVLATFFSMRFIAEGKDFHFGYKGSCGKKEIEDFAHTGDLQTLFPNEVLYKGERISSSVIRQRIFNGNFAETECLLGHRFKIDMNGIPFKKDSDNALVFEKSGFTQVLPEHGTYNVIANTSRENLRACLEADLKTIRLFGAAFNKLPRIRAVEFL